LLDQKFFTFREYMRKADMLTPSMQDYLEMICRQSGDIGFTRIHDLASALNVQPPSATKMVQKLADFKLVKYEKYGVVLLTEEGLRVGKILLERHRIVESFLKLLGVTEGLLEETEKVEHTIGPQTLKGIIGLLKFFQDRPRLLEELEEKRKEKD
jgi:Mn-dependent DtxR family transcriptional regulator